MIAIEIVQNGNVVTLAGADNLEGGSVTVIVDGPGSDDSKGKLTVFGIWYST